MNSSLDHTSKYSVREKVLGRGEGLSGICERIREAIQSLDLGQPLSPELSRRQSGFKL